MTPPRVTEAEAVAYVENVELEMLALLEQRTRTANGDASASRRVARRLLLDLAGRVTVSDIDCQGEDARRAALADLDALRLHISTHGQRPQ